MWLFNLFYMCSSNSMVFLREKGEWKEFQRNMSFIIIFGPKLPLSVVLVVLDRPNLGNIRGFERVQSGRHGDGHHLVLMTPWLEEIYSSLSWDCPAKGGCEASALLERVCCQEMVSWIGGHFSLPQPCRVWCCSLLSNWMISLQLTGPSSLLLLLW